MNERPDWHNRNPFMEQFVYPPPEIAPALIPATNWVHVPPQTMPWGLPANAHPPVVRFTAGDLIPYQSHHPVKRKTDLEVELPPPKQLVTEEKMAAHMSNLHISDIKPPTEPGPANISCDDDAMEHERLPRLVVSEEIKKIKTDPIIPQSILSSLEKPKMALVLWQPPAGDIGAKLREAKQKREEEEEKEKEKETELEVTMEGENNNINTFRPIDPVPMLENEQSHFLQPTPQFNQYYPFS